MAKTPDRFPGEREDEGLLLDEDSVEPTQNGEMKYVSGSFKAKDGTGVFNLRSGGGGISEAQHHALDYLGHEIDEDAYEEFTFTGNNITNVTIWTDSGKTTKIREFQYVYSVGKISTETVIQYDGAGSEKERLVLTYSFTGNKIDNIDYAFTAS